MTTQEFKQKYPQFAHLEGDQLWNAMEDILFGVTARPLFRTQEEIEKSQREHPENWLSIKEGELTFNVYKGPEYNMADFAPKASTEPIKKLFLLPGIGLSDDKTIEPLP